MAVAVIALSVGFINNRSGLRTTDLHLDSNVRAADKPDGMETGRANASGYHALYRSPLKTRESVSHRLLF